MISRFFIDRPIFATVLSIVITLAGGIALLHLPLALYPPISPPVVQVDCVYPGASAQVVAETVAAPIEEEVNGVERMMYMSSQCTNDGSYNLMVTFEHGVDLNMAQVLVQNRVNLALPRLPEVIKKTGVTTRKRSPDILMAVGLYSPDGRYDQLYLSNFALMQVRDEIARLPGVSAVTMLGERDYSMRIWVDPEQLASRGLSAGDVVSAVREQNAEVAVGHLGAGEPSAVAWSRAVAWSPDHATSPDRRSPDRTGNLRSGQVARSGDRATARGQQPTPHTQDFHLTLSTLGRLTNAAQFGDIILRATADGRVTRLKDVARVELGPKDEEVTCHVDGRPSASLTIWQLPDANALDTAQAVRDKLDELKKEFPPGIDYVVRYDTAPYIRETIEEVFRTLRDGVLLVAFVVLLFLQNWRTALIPLVAVPVAIVGTFAVMLVFGFTLNNLTLFGLVLAIGIVVDDAIVVVEAVEHHIEQGLSPKSATIKAMQQVSGPVIAVGAVLSAVFVPCAFISGITGLFFRQFALTIAASTLISALNSLTLSPALTSVLLRPQRKEDRDPLPRFAFALFGAWIGWRLLVPRLAPHLSGVAAATGIALPWLAGSIGIALAATAGWLIGPPLNHALGWLFWLFNASFQSAAGLYTRMVGMLLRVSFLVIVVYGGILALTYWGFRSLPTGFIPSQDMGFLYVNVQLPDAASSERTRQVMEQMEQIALKTRGVRHAMTIAGQSFLLSAYGSNFGSMIAILDDFDKRRDPELYGEAIAAELRRRFAGEVPDAVVSVYPPPPIRGVGRAGGFKLMIEDRGDAGLAALQQQTEHLTDAGSRQPGLVGLTSVFRANVPQVFVDVDRRQAMKMHVSLKDVFDTLQTYLGSLYVNDFNRFGRTWQVIVQADARFRSDADHVRQLKVRNAQGGMVPLGAVANLREVNGPLILTRYNMYPASFINGTAAPGASSGQALARMEELARHELPPSMTVEWTEIAYLEVQAGSTGMVIFGFSVAMVFLVLAALYESWSLPLAVILAVPLCLLSSMTGVYATGTDINILTQVGFVVLVGLASKNAILIVEFAKRRREAGVKRFEATLEACQLRLRPIVMTSLAFILGVVPLMVSRGAGAEMRRTLGIAVFSGMLGVTLFGIFLTPVFFYVINRLSESRLFASPRVRLAGRVLISVLTLGVTWAAETVSRRSRRPALASVSSANGDTRPRAAGKSEAARLPIVEGDPVA